MFAKPITRSLRQPSGNRSSLPGLCALRSSPHTGAHDSSMCSQLYYRSVVRTPVPQHLIPWTALWPDYSPVAFELDFAGKSWADAPIGAFDPKWNQMDGRVDRRSHQHSYDVRDGYPLNPLGRTGLALRGLLGRWGPNHAVDAVVTRWKRDASGRSVVDAVTRRPVVQFVAIQRRDTGQWALPGGMVDAGETVDCALVRELAEEALGGRVSEADRLVGVGREVYRGCVADPRNTDNAWMETVVKVFDADGRQMALRAGDDAVGARWMDATAELELYASHALFVERAKELLFGK